MFIQQQTLQPQRHVEELEFLRELIPLVSGEALTACQMRYDALWADSEAKLIDYNPREVPCT